MNLQFPWTLFGYIDWWRKLKTKCMSDNFKMLLTILAVLVTNSHIFNVEYQDLKDVTNFNKSLSPLTVDRILEVFSKTTWSTETYQIMSSNNIIDTS